MADRHGRLRTPKRYFDSALAHFMAQLVFLAAQLPLLSSTSVSTTLAYLNYTCQSILLVSTNKHHHYYSYPGVTVRRSTRSVLQLTALHQGYNSPLYKITMGLRKLFGQKKKAAGDQKCLWSATLRQPPASYQPHIYRPVPAPPPPPPPPTTPPITETSSIIYAPHYHTTHTRQDFYNPRRRVSPVWNKAPVWNEDQSPRLRLRRLRMQQQQQYPDPSSTPPCIRCGLRYKAQPTSIDKSNYTYGPPSEESPPPDPRLTGPDMVDTFATMCRILILLFCFAIGIFVTVFGCGIWILAKISSTLEINGIPPPEGEGEGEEITEFRPADLPVEPAHWRVMAWACEQSFRQLRRQSQESPDDQVPECEPPNMAHNAARKAWAIHAGCPNCQD